MQWLLLCDTSNGVFSYVKIAYIFYDLCIDYTFNIVESYKFKNLNTHIHLEKYTIIVLTRITDYMVLADDW